MNSKYPWTDGTHRISYEKRETRDGTKEFVMTSLSHAKGIGIPSTPLPPQPTGDGDGDGDGDEDVGARKRASQLKVTELTEEWRAEGRKANSTANLDSEFAKFVDHFRATGKPMKDWLAAWRNWCRRSAQFGKPDRSTPPPPKTCSMCNDLETQRVDGAGYCDAHADLQREIRGRGAPIVKGLADKMRAA